MACMRSVALSVAGIASAANKPVEVTAGNLEMTFNGGFTPKVLPKNNLRSDRSHRVGQNQNRSTANTRRR